MRKFISALVLLCSSVCIGQSLPDAPKPHRFFDKTNDALIAGVVTVTTLDGWSTQQFVKYAEYDEGDPITRPLVMRHWSGQVAANAIVVGATVFGSYWLHKHKHHRLERWLPVVVIACDGYVAVDNINFLHTISSQKLTRRPGW